MQLELPVGAAGAAESALPDSALPDSAKGAAADDHRGDKAPLLSLNFAKNVTYRCLAVFANLRHNSAKSRQGAFAIEVVFVFLSSGIEEVWG